MFKLAALVLVSTLLFFGLRVAVEIISRDSVATGPITEGGKVTLGDCPDKPNCVSSNASRDEQYTEPFAYTIADDQVIPVLASLLVQFDEMAVETQTDTYLHATYSTPVMGYVDDVELLVDATSREVLARSASRLGHSDLGKNRERIDALRLQAASLLASEAS